RGGDIPRNPLPHAFAILHEDARVELYVHPAKLDSLPESCTTNGVIAHETDSFAAAITLLSSPVRVDPASIPLAIVTTLEEVDITPAFAADPCIMPKACKSEAEIKATSEAHLRDGAALCEFLTWFEAQAPDTITEIDVVT